MHSADKCALACTYSDIWSARKVVSVVLLVAIVCGSVSADCGCGRRCQRYVIDHQCTRCCTTTVKRSVSYSQYPEQADTTDVWPKKKYDDHLNQLGPLLPASVHFSPSKQNVKRLHTTLDNSQHSQLFVMRSGENSVVASSQRRQKRALMAEIVEKLVESSQNERRLEELRKRSKFLPSNSQTTRRRVHREVSSSTHQVLNIFPVLRH